MADLGLNTNKGGVSTPHAVYKSLEDQWERCRDVSAGSDDVKFKKTKYLPALDSHKENKPEKYVEYLMRALFYGATGRTIQGLSGAIFQKAPSVVIPNKQAQEDAKDITLTGEPLEAFALRATQEYLTVGRYGILVDMATGEATKPRPYWVGYAAEDIINWRFDKQGGDQELTMVVLREYEDEAEPADEFDIAQIEQFRVLRLTNGVYTQQIYKAEKSPLGNKMKWIGGPVVTPQRRGKALDFIPFALPWVVGKPPLLDLVDVNLAHYRGTADLKHGLHFTALPTPWVSGVIGSGDKPLSIGSGTAWSLDKDGKAGMLEFTGKGLAAIRTDLQDMQKMMATLGARLLEEAPHYAETALSVSMRHSSDYATLRTIAQVVEQQLSFAMQIHCWWLDSEELVANVKAKVELNKVFFDQSVSADELRALLMALQARTISFKTFYARLSNTGWTREGVDSDEELKDIASQPSDIAVKPTPAGGPAATAIN